MPPTSPNLAAVVVAETNMLVVEDQRAVAGALRMRLRGLGYDVMAIALPPGFYLFATPLIGLALNRIGERYRQGQGPARG